MGLQSVQEQPVPHEGALEQTRSRQHLHPGAGWLREAIVQCR